MTQKDENNTTDYYNNNADQWARTHHGYLEGTYWSEEMSTLQKYLPSGHILEIGSGLGRDARALIERGYEYTGTDISHGLLKVARERNPNISFLKKSVYNLNFDATFDGFWTVATLFHVPKKRITEALDKIRQNMKSNAVGFIAIKMGKDEKVEESTQRFFAYYSHNEFAQILKESNYEVLHSDTKQSANKTRWLMYWVKVKE